MAMDSVPGRGRVARKALTDATLQVVVAAPASGSHIVVYGFLLANTGAAASVFALKDGATTVFDPNLPIGTPLYVSLPVAWHLTSATALQVQQTAAQTGVVTALFDVMADPA